VICQQDAKRKSKVKRLIDNGYSVFITGKGGSGKSFFIRYIIEQLRAKDVCCFVAAPTGKAASNIGGSTVHYFAGVGTGSKGSHELISMILEDQEALERWKTCKVLVIDEVSMLSRELFEKLEIIARCLKNSSRPFGGIQLILSGDFYQLKPVTHGESILTSEGVYCFASPMWDCCVDVSVSFDQNYRQHETDLIDLLDDFRTSEFLSQPSRHYVKDNLSRPLMCNPLDIVRLYSHKESVSQANDECLALLPGMIALLSFEVEWGRGTSSLVLHAGPTFRFLQTLGYNFSVGSGIIVITLLDVFSLLLTDFKSTNICRPQPYYPIIIYTVTSVLTRGPLILYIDLVQLPLS
jgi:ATP-dependent DNA helicase PIF1